MRLKVKFNGSVGGSKLNAEWKAAPFFCCN